MQLSEQGAACRLLAFRIPHRGNCFRDQGRNGPQRNAQPRLRASEYPNLHRWATLSFRERAILYTLIGFLICFTLGGVSRAQKPPQIRGEINNTQIVRLAHTTHPLVRTLIDCGQVEGEKSLGRMLLVLSPPAENEEELKKLLEEQQNPNSPNYHRWVTAEEFAARFGLADADVQAVRAWLEQAGFTVGAVARSKRWIEFSGSARQ